MGMLFVDEKPAARDEAVVSFDRWLAAHDAEVAAKAHMEALEEAASIAEWLEFGPAPAFSQPAAHKWGALKAAERISARAAELTRDTPSR
jgi:hypothetical protein